MGWSGNVVGKRTGMLSGFWWESQKRPVGRRRCRWENNIKMDLRELGWGCMDWIHQPRDRHQSLALVNM
jgi:hypothetical protein